MRHSLMVLALVSSANACNGGRPPAQEVEGGCRYVETRGRCRLSDVTVGPASSDDPSLVAVRATYAWQGDAPAELRGATKVVEWTVPRDRADAAQAHARAHADLACWVALDSGGCPPDGPQLVQGALPPP